ncbi:hypothetical protein DPMN_103608 [Dreissena polymorpha]|uniref:Uncharacterized protein n=1 Tax=Dreissena polymorpha TaxID=45954 RepID=A0A9D4HBD6_DREPO|nr:hypothetical protein DPMN_103608 [Dreissena polymorpha]
MLNCFRCACLQGWKSDEHCSTNVSTPALCMPGYRGEKCSVSDCGEYGYGKPIGDSEEYM